jgi:hypothetical protein
MIFSPTHRRAARRAQTKERISKMRKWVDKRAFRGALTTAILLYAFGLARVANATQEEIAPYPFSATPITASATGTAGAANSAALAGATGATTYLCAAIITSLQPAAVENGVVTISDGTFTLKFDLVESVTLGGQLILPFSPCLKASATNTAITVSVPAISSGAATAISAAGFQL